MKFNLTPSILVEDTPEAVETALEALTAAGTDPEWVSVLRARYDRYMSDEKPDEPTVYRTKSGRILTDADIEALSDEAERGYDPIHIQDSIREWFASNRPCDG